MKISFANDEDVFALSDTVLREAELTGPKSERPGFGTLGEAMSGFANITGEAGGPPTLPRLVPSGDFGDTDVYGCQQHAPLLDVDLPI